MQSIPALHGWTLDHDGDGVAWMRAPGVRALDTPTATKVYDKEMLAQDEADNKKLDWRVVFNCDYSWSEQPAAPRFSATALHVYAGKVGQDRDASVNLPQKKKSLPIRSCIHSRTTLASSQGSQGASS